MRLYVRFLLVIVVVVSFESNQKLSEQNNIQNDTTTVISWFWLPENATMDYDASDMEDNEVTEMKIVSKLWERLNVVNKNITKDEKPKASNGTNWCGRLGKPIADIDFSKYMRTNACCEVHLQSMSIEIANDMRYKCSTDLQFYDCLKTVNSSMSKTVGNYYFNVLRPLCYHIEQDELCEDGMLCTLLIRILSKIVPEY